MAHTLAAELGLDVPIPTAIEIGRGAVLLLRGSVAASSRRRLARLIVELDGERWYANTRGDARFFLPIPLRVRCAGNTVHLRVTADLGGDTVGLVDQSIAIAPAPRPPLDISTPVVICLGTYNPDEALLVRQLESLRAQTRRDWSCIVHDDASTPDRFAVIERHLAGDDRFRLVRSDLNRGFYRNFEAALALVPRSTSYVALSDQDDFWYPDKLAITIAAVERDRAIQLAYSDMRIVDRDGAVRSTTHWMTRRNNYRHLDALLFVNTVSGAASVFRGSLLDALLPFPPAYGPMFHDHWLACVAMMAGGLAFVDQPLYDYTHHQGNVIGHRDFATLTPARALLIHAKKLAELLLKPGAARDHIGRMRTVYDEDYRRLRLFAETLRLRFPDATDEQRRMLALFDDTLANVPRLALLRHIGVLRRGDDTDMVEVRLGMALLLHHALRRR
jgi:glycosyltransferase involved in cell wall biosynthesis